MIWKGQNFQTIYNNQRNFGVYLLSKNQENAQVLFQIGYLCVIFVILSFFIVFEGLFAQLLVHFSEVGNILDSKYVTD